MKGDSDIMRKLYGKKLSMVLATTLTVANMGALMPMTAFAATNDISAYTWSGTAKTAETIYKGQEITLKLDWGADLTNGDYVSIYADKAVKVGDATDATNAGTELKKVTGQEDGEQKDTGLLTITPTETGSIKFTAKLKTSETEEEKAVGEVLTAAVKEASITGLTASSDVSSVYAGGVRTVKVTATETFDNALAAKDITWAVYKKGGSDPVDTTKMEFAANAFVQPGSDKTEYKEEVNLTVKDGADVADYEIKATVADTELVKTIPLSVLALPTVKVTDGKYTGASSGTIAKGETIQLSAFVDQQKVNASDVTWAVGDTYKDKVSVDKNGLVTANDTVTEATVTATYKVDKDINVTATFTLDVTTADLVVKAPADLEIYDPNNFLPGDTVQLTTMYGTTDITKKATYSSDDTSVATVNSAGLVTAVAAGEATITVKYGSYKKTIDVTVSTPAADDYAVKSESGENTVIVGKGLQLKLTFGGNDTSEKVSWSSGTPGKATVDSKGLVTGVDAGDSTITASFVANGETLTREFTVTVKAAEWNLTDDNDKDYIINNDYETTATMIEGQKLTFYPTFGGDPVVGTWSVASTANVKVSNGVITAKMKTSSAQAVTFKADLNGDKDTDDANEKLTIKVTVEEAQFALTSKESTHEVEVGNGLQLIAKYGVEDVTNDSYITYKSSKESVAKVDANGLVTGVAEGGATITATYKMNGVDVTDTYDVDVIAVKDETTEANAAAKAANDAAKKATDAANEAASAADAATKAAEAAKTAPNKDTVAAARTAIDKATKAAEAAKAAAKEAKELAAKADEAAENASGQAADDAAKAAEAANAAAKAAEGAATKAETAASAAKTTTDEAEKASKQDGSEAGKPAAEGSELKDAATGDGTGYVVTNATAGKAEVEYKGSDADRKSGKITIPEKVRDASGNEYAVTAIADNAFKGADTKEIVVPKTVVKIGKKAFYNSKAKKITIKTNKKGKIKIGAGAFKKLPKKSKIIVKGAKGDAKTNLIKKIEKQTNTKRTTVK